MILEKLQVIENEAKKKIQYEKNRLESSKRFRKYLDQIDIQYEEVRVNNKPNLLNLMTSLKGDTLNKNENDLITEITN